MVLQFKTICLLVCSKNGLIIQNHLLTCLFVCFLKNGLIIQKPFTYLFACLENGLQFKNHLLTCLLEKWFTIQNHLNTSAKLFIIIIIIHQYLENEFRTLTFFYLLNFEHDSTIFPPLLLTYTFDVLYLIRQHNQPNTIRYLLCVIYYALCTMHYALCTIYYSLYTMYYALCTMHYVLYTMHYALCTIHYAYVFMRIHTYLLFYMYLYVFTISSGKFDEIP